MDLMKSGTTKTKKTMSGNNPRVKDVTHSKKDWDDFWYNEDARN